MKQNYGCGTKADIGREAKCRQQQGSRRLHFAHAVHSRHLFPSIGDAAYRKHARAGPSHGHMQHAQKIS